jgi:hypothetical protein
VGILGRAKRITHRLAGEFAELQPRYHLVYLYVLRSLGTCFTFDDLLDFDQVQDLEEIGFRAVWEIAASAPAFRYES